MPQEFHVLRCFSCSTFQVHIVKKSNKWSCKMCEEKQSLKKVYGKGSGKDCRLLVQSLNEKRIINELNESTENNFIHNEEISENTTVNLEPKQSKWNDYLTEENQLSESENDVNNGYTFERPNKRKFGKKDGNERKKKIKTNIQEYNDNENNLNCEEVNINSQAANELPRNKENYKRESKWNSFVAETENNFDSDEFQINVPKKIELSNKNESKWSSFVSTELDVPKKIEESNKKESKWASFITPTKLEDSDNFENKEENALKVTNIFSSTDVDLDDILDF